MRGGQYQQRSPGPAARASPFAALRVRDPGAPLSGPPAGAAQGELKRAWRSFELGLFPALPKPAVAPSFPPVRAPSERPRYAVVAQLVRAPVCGTGGRWFEPTQLYHYRHMLPRSNEPAGFSTAGREFMFAIATPFTQNLSTESCGEGRSGDVRFAFRELACGLGGGDAGVGIGHTRERLGLHGRATASLHERRLSSLQFRDPKYRSHHHLHGAAPIAAVAGMPGSVHIGARAGGLRRRT